MESRLSSAWKSGLGILLILVAVFPLLGQDNGAPLPYPSQGRQRAMRGQGDRSGGTITSVGVDRFEIKGMNGETQTILVGDSTRISEGPRENQKQLGLEDLKPGDRVMVMGKMNDQQQFVAAAVHRMTQEEMARFGNAGGRAFGQIVSINGNEIKVHNQFRGDMTVVVNDKTTFSKNEQTIALKDLKVGDRIFATGNEADGKLVANHVGTGRFQLGRGRMMPPPGEGQPPPQND
jgi:Domain of unknown function (DUF5666)